MKWLAFSVAVLVVYYFGWLRGRNALSLPRRKR